MSSADLNSSSNWQIYRRLLGYLRPFWVAFSIAVVGNVLYAAAATGMAAAMEFVIEAIENPTAANRLFVPALIVGIFAVRGLGYFLSNYYINTVGRNIVNLMRTQIFDHFMRLPCRFFDDRSTGHLVSKITFNVEQVTGAATSAVTIMLREGLTIIGLLGYMFYVNWKLTLIFMALGPLIGGLVSFVSKRFRRLSQKIQNSMGDVTHVASEAISGFRVVRTFGGGDFESERFAKVSRDNLRQSMKMALTQSISTPVVQILIAFSIAVLVWIALAPQVQQGMTTGEFVAFITAATTLAKPIRQLTSVQAKVQKGIAASHDVFSSLDVDVEADNGVHAPKCVRGEIDFRDVHFRYKDESDEILRGLSFRIEPGTTVAFVGRSGSGKSSLISLLPRFYEYTSGEIRLDGMPLKDYKLAALREQIALVNQNVVLFNDTVANNIAYGSLRDATEAEIREAARKAHALEFIDHLQGGMQTMIGDNGVMLSGGQRQRLAIARALLKDAPILILDEATSALDTESERYIQEALETVMRGRTTLVIAHRLSTVENADKIIVMDDGRIAEEGTHRELISQQGPYAQLHSLQFSE